MTLKSAALSDGGLDLNLFWIVIALCVVQIVRLVPRRSSDGSWIAVCLAIIAGSLASRIFSPELSDWISSGLFAVLFLAPVLIANHIARLSLLMRYRAALYFARVLRILHPFKRYRFMPVFLAALYDAQRGRHEEALATLTQLMTDGAVSADVRLQAISQICRLTSDWRPLLDRSVRAAFAYTGAYRANLPRAFGETGQLSSMIAAYHSARDDLDAISQGLAKLAVMAFCGREQDALALLNGVLAGMMSDESQGIWLATARLAGEGDATEARQRLSRIAQTAKDDTVRRSAQHRLDAPPVKAREVLNPNDYRLLDAMAAEEDTGNPLEAASEAKFSPIISFGLIVLNGAMFAVEMIMGGSEDEQTLLRLGALWPPNVIEGHEWWRLLTCTFLHYGSLHLAFNMFALLVLGPFVERVMGRGRMLVVYLGAGVGSSAGVLALMQQGIVDENELLGASGAIFGLVGAQVVLFLYSWLRRGSHLAGRRLANLGIAIGLQVVFDITTPQVSMSAHMFGLLIGALLTLALNLVLGWDRSNTADRLKPQAG